MSLIASVLHLTRKDVQALKINDAYTLHKVVYSLYPDVRTAEEKRGSTPSGFLYADLGGDYKSRKILLLSNREPALYLKDDNGHGEYGVVQSKQVSPDFLTHKNYRFNVIVNPTQRNNKSRQIIPVKGRENIAEWFSSRAEKSWGFKVNHENLQIGNVNVLKFKGKEQHSVTLAQAQVQGTLEVINSDQFAQSFCQGIGRGRAFGCGLLQIVPIIEY
ncbi:MULTISPECIES: type I-E CRISPR-associated protein Cas6/Cse3/CasE [unclassified Providencia]|uniref:type I-E CRISPR-associated protein Cas6/Cse3/CasE n=1 Tax=unclassified Providencia TaxID=2633465 RepID=UPI00234B61C1|nr:MULTISPECIES: type I-E CRISPR-associated protein Cas6/Cse3/CasE [unclassified Providencia]